MIALTKALPFTIATIPREILNRFRLILTDTPHFFDQSTCGGTPVHGGKPMHGGAHIHGGLASFGGGQGPGPWNRVVHLD